MKHLSIRSVRGGALASLIFAGALGCEPEFNLGSVAVPSSEGPQCGVTTLASGLFSPNNIVLAGDSIYVAARGSSNAVDDSRVVKVPLAGGDPVVLATAQAITVTFVNNASDIFWSVFFSSGLTKSSKIPIGGGPITEVGDWSDAWIMAVDAENLYWGPDGIMKKAPLQGGPATILASFQSNLVEAIAADAVNVYWSALDGSVRKVPISGGPSTILASGLLNAYYLVVDATNVYWVTDAPMDAGAVMKVPIDGSAPPVSLGEAHGVPVSLTVSEGYAYWIGGHVLRRVSVLGGEEEVLFNGTHVDQGPITACPGGVCWADPENGTLMRFVDCSR